VKERQKRSIGAEESKIKQETGQNEILHNSDNYSWFIPYEIS